MKRMIRQLIRQLRIMINGYLFFLFVTFTATSVFAGEQGITYVEKDNIHYYNDNVCQSDDYIAQQCVLDLYYPQNKSKYPTVVWFHGGGLTGGQHAIPEQLKQQGMAVVAVEYRLYPHVSSPKYIEDAAAAVSWVFKHVHEYGGDTSAIFVSGHSAGGYLTLMLGLDKHYLGQYGIDANRIAGLIPFSGHTITHFTIRKERGIPGTQAIVDSFAPLYHVRADAPSILLITGDRDKEMLGRYEENAYFWRMMQLVGHPSTELYELEGYGHNMCVPAYPLLLEEVERIIRAE